VPALIIHDRDDADVPWQQAELLAKAWPGARLLLTRGLGHMRILRNRDVIQTSVDFIAGKPA
jgi:pimeloyl-ACP methyl ester carboxylesterase